MAIEFAAAGADVAINWLDDERLRKRRRSSARTEGAR